MTVRRLEGKLSGEIAEDTVVFGATEGRVVVRSNVALHVQGAVAGELVIEEDATVTVKGVVIGRVTNRGTLRTNGLILGRVQNIGRATVEENVDVDALYVHSTQPHPRAENAQKQNESLSNAQIDRDLVLNGSIHSATVAEGVFVQINGSVHGELVVSPRAEVRINGSVHARVRNRGRVDVYGNIRDGEIIDEAGGSSDVHEGRRIR